MKIFYLTIVLLFFLACSTTNDDAEDKYQTIEFNINFELLSLNPFIHNDLAINIPLNWEEISSEQFDAMEKIFKQDTLMNSFNLIKGHSNSSSLILFSESDLLQKQHVLENFTKKLEVSFPKESIHKDKFTINGVKVDQFIATNKTHTTFHLFIELDNLYLMEFLIPLETYEEQIQAIESTIGTIKRKEEINESYS